MGGTVHTFLRPERLKGGFPVLGRGSRTFPTRANFYPDNFPGADHNSGLSGPQTKLLEPASFYNSTFNWPTISCRFSAWTKSWPVPPPPRFFNGAARPHPLFFFLGAARPERVLWTRDLFPTPGSLARSYTPWGFPRPQALVLVPEDGGPPP